MCVYAFRRIALSGCGAGVRNGIDAGYGKDEIFGTPRNLVLIRTRHASTC